MSAQAWHCIIIASVMKLLFKLVEIEFSLLDPGHFSRTYYTNNVSGPDITEGTCYFNGSKYEIHTGVRMTTSWLYTGRYLLPVLGGLISSAWLGCIRVLQIGGLVMLLSTVLVSVSVYLGLMCEDSPIILITWLLLPVFFGLVQPNIQLSFFCWYRKNKLCTVATTVYCAIAALGDLIASTFVNMYFASANVFVDNCTLVFVAASLAFLSMTAFMPKFHEEEPFEFPNKRRMMKYFQIFSAIILVLTVLNDSPSAINLSEMRYFMNETIDTVVRPWLSPSWMRDLTMVVVAPSLILAAFKSRRRLDVPFRMLSGILLKCAVELCLIIVTSIGLASVTATLAVYLVVFILNGVAQLLVTVGAYDLGCSLLPDSSQCLMLGVMFTVWGLAVFFSRGFLFIVKEINKLQTGSKPLFFVYHLISVLMLICCFVYYKFVTLPMANRMAVLSEEEAAIDGAALDQSIDDSGEDDSDPELRSLIN